MEFKDRLKQLRKEKHLTQKELAELLGMAKGTVAMWEMGARRPTLETFEKLCDIFDRKLGYLLGSSDDTSSPELTDREIDELGKWEAEDFFYETLMKYLRLDERGKGAVEALIDAEFKMCRNENSLFPKTDFKLSVRIKNE